MKIATLVRGMIPTPRPSDMVYAPIDLAMAISEHLAQWGHKVDYFGPIGTKLQHANVETMSLRPLAPNLKEWTSIVTDIDLQSYGIPDAWDHFYALEMFERARRGEYDLLHFHHPEAARPFVKLFPDVPVVYTLHNPTDPIYREVFEMYMTPNQFFISISNNQRHAAPDLPYIDTVYNGIETDLFTFEEEKDDFLLTIGRIVPEKGIKEAIQVARQTNHKLYIIGPLYESTQAYYEKHVKPHLSENILYLGFLEREQLARYFQKAKAFLMIPVDRDEPFGLTMIEAMSCGTPVIGMRRGSIPEVIKDKKTGFVVDSLAEMEAAIKKIGKIKPSDCREHVEQYFSTEVMAKNYEAAYAKVLKAFKKPVLNLAAVKSETETMPLGSIEDSRISI